MNTAAERATQRCEKCARLICTPEPHCANGRFLDPFECPDFKDASREHESHAHTLHRWVRTR